MEKQKEVQYGTLPLTKMKPTPSLSASKSKTKTPTVQINVSANEILYIKYIYLIVCTKLPSKAVT